MNCTLCGHPASEHMRHEDAVLGISDKRELCLSCDGYVVVVDDYEVDGYDYKRTVGTAWHRFRDA